MSEVSRPDELREALAFFDRYGVDGGDMEARGIHFVDVFRAARAHLAFLDDPVAWLRANGTVNEKVGEGLPNWSPRQPERIEDLKRSYKQRRGQFGPWQRDIAFLIEFYEAALSSTGETHA